MIAAECKEIADTFRDENKQLKFDLDRVSRQVLDFPRREEEILRDAEKMLRLRSASLRLEDAKIKTQMQELKQLGFWKSRVDKLEKDNKHLKELLQSERRQRAIQSSAFRDSRTIGTSNIDVKKRNVTRPQTAGALPSRSHVDVSVEKMHDSNDDVVDHAGKRPTSDKAIIKYQKLQLQNASEVTQELNERVNYLSHALAKARAYPLLQTRIGKSCIIYMCIYVYLYLDLFAIVIIRFMYTYTCFLC